jgi:hypothetical protein
MAASTDQSSDDTLMFPGRAWNGMLNLQPCGQESLVTHSHTDDTSVEVDARVDIWRHRGQSIRSIRTPDDPGHTDLQILMNKLKIQKSKNDDIFERFFWQTFTDAKSFIITRANSYIENRPIDTLQSCADNKQAIWEDMWKESSPLILCLKHSNQPGKKFNEYLLD